MFLNKIGVVGVVGWLGVENDVCTKFLVLDHDSCHDHVEISTEDNGEVGRRFEVMVEGVKERKSKQVGALCEASDITSPDVVSDTPLSLLRLFFSFFYLISYHLFYCMP